MEVVATEKYVPPSGGEIGVEPGTVWNSVVTEVLPVIWVITEPNVAVTVGPNVYIIVV
ncbi:MAG: hypothetical protein GXO39_06520 [Thermotogae bacterium]|nr:hypothetical protein [Thermotogota bacterium]